MTEPAASQEIFISYAHQDGESVRRLVEALRRQGIDVWWDQDIVASQNWENEIDRAIRRSRGVIVVWSQHSVISEEVKEEANYARSQNKLIPVRLDRAEIPIRYRRIQTVDISRWTGGDEDAEFRALLDGVRAAQPGAAGPRASGHTGASTSFWTPNVVSWTWILLPSVALGGLAVLLMSWRPPTEMEIEVTCSRVRFRSAGKDQILVNSTLARSIVLHGFEEVRLQASSLEAANPAKWNEKTDAYPEDAWRKIRPDGRLTFRPSGSSSAQITLQPAERSAGPLGLENIFTQPAAITLSSPAKDTVNVDVAGRRTGGAVSLPERFTLIAADCSIQGTELPWRGPSVTLRLSAPRQSRLLDYSSGDSGITLVLELPADYNGPIREPSAFQIDQLEFLNQGPAGSPVSSIRAHGTIRYPQYPAVQPAALKAGDFLTLQDLRSFYLRDVAFTDKEKSLRLSFRGVAGRAVTGPAADAMRDLRLTRFDMLWNNQRVVALFTVFAWLVVTSIGLRRYLKDHRAGK